MLRAPRLPQLPAGPGLLPQVTVLLFACHRPVLRAEPLPTHAGPGVRPPGPADPPADCQPWAVRATAAAAATAQRPAGPA